ncbi:MAG: ankyrin repeat domain-containing protein, partial [Hyphomicrobiaceae bacterium]
PLHIAAHRRNIEMARTLVKGGANPRALDGRGYDIIAIAAVQDDLPFLKAAIELGADPKAVIGSWGGTALNVAAQLGHAEVVNALIKAGAPVDHRNKAGWTPLIEAIQLGDGKAGCLAAVKALLDGGADPGIADRKGTTPFELARKRGFAEIATAIKAKGGK